MTEAEWLTCTDPGLMLDFLRGRASERKQRLVAAACCRYFFCDPHGGHAESEELVLEPLEWWVNGLLGNDARERAEGETVEMDDYGFYASDRREALLAVSAPVLNCKDVLSKLATFIDHQGVYAVGELDSTASHFIRDVFGNPFHPIVMNFGWLTPAVTALVQSVWDDRAFERMPGLADVFATAGCKNEDILDHCRGPGPHVRGCWVIDLVLGKA